MSVTPSCIALDFDHTLVHYQDGYGGLYKIFTDLGIPLPAIQGAYKKTKYTTGFSIAALMDVLEAEHGIVLPRESIERQFGDWMEKTLKLYPDAKDFLNKLSQNPWATMAIVTRGDPVYQRYKIMKTGIKPHRLHIVSGPNSKASAFHILLKELGSPILYVDDRASELDQIRLEHKDPRNLHLYHIVRPQSAYEYEQGEFPHSRIQSLDELTRFYKIGG